MNSKKYIDFFNQVVDLTKNFTNITGNKNYEAEYCLAKVKGYVDGLFTLSKFKVGDTVQLNKAPIIERNSGWYGAKHFLVPGSIATVCEIDFDAGFVYGLKFDNDSWISIINGQINYRSPENRGIYCFSESFLDAPAKPAYLKEFNEFFDYLW